MLQASKLAPPVGLEPTTCRLTVGRSTIELQGNIFNFQFTISDFQKSESQGILYQSRAI